MEAALAHPIFRPLRAFLDPLAAPFRTDLEQLNALADSAGLRVKSGKALRFVAPSATASRYGDYEMRVFRTGCVETRPENRHDFFNALAWLAFPATKAELNALHAGEIPLEQGRRGRFRDLLTLLDEGGAIVGCDDRALIEMLRGHRWKELFWKHRARVREAMQVHVLGHAVLEQALRPWPGITCKVMIVAAGGNPDESACAWLRGLRRTATPRDLASLPVFGYPGWSPGSEREEFYDDQRYFRPLAAPSPVKMRSGVGQAAAVAVRRAEESPGSAERDAG